MTVPLKPTDIHGEPLRDNALEAEAYREIVLRHGTKVTLEQVMDTLLDMGWTPPNPKAARRAPAAVARTEDCATCMAAINPDTVSTLCRLPIHMCPYKAARFR